MHIDLPSGETADIFSRTGGRVNIIIHAVDGRIIHRSIYGYTADEVAAALKEVA